MEKKGRIPFYYGKQKVYEWEQNLEEVIIYIEAPEYILPKNREIIKRQLKPGQQIPKLDIKITPTHLTVGIKDLPPYLSEDFSQNIKASESLWSLEDGEIIITLEKAIKGNTWESVFKGQEKINPLQKEEVQKKMVLERLQEENHGFNFSDAEINGNVPDPKTFMG